MSRTLKNITLCLVSALSIIIFSLNSEAQKAPNAQNLKRRQALNQKPDKIDQKMTRILKDWSDASKDISRLEGRHTRIVYESTFKTAKYCEGLFLYESPDKGRIDLTPVKMKKKTITKDEITYTFKSQDPERWICDGKRIQQIQDKEKLIQVVPIPPEAQGENIMDGPLPFLFGMAPEKARRRYYLKYKGETDKHYRLYVQPKLKKDATNWKEAFVFLSKKTYLPNAVQLIDPTETVQTVYTFNEIEINKRRGLLTKWFKGDPYNPRLIGYKREIPKSAPDKLKRTVEELNGIHRPKPKALPKNNLAKVPTVKGLPYKEAKAKMVSQGLIPKLKRGLKTTNPNLVHRVQFQSPKPGAVIKKGDKVFLTLYTKQAQPEGKRSASKPNN